MIEKGQLLLYIYFFLICLSLLLINVYFVLPLAILCLYFPILNKNNFSFVEFIFIISLISIYFRYILLTYFGFSFVYIKFFPLDMDTLYSSTVISLLYYLVFSYILFFLNAISKRYEVTIANDIDTDRTNTILTVMLVIKLFIFYFASIKMGESTSITQKIVDMIIANLFLIDLLFLITFVEKNVSKINLLLFVLISIVTASKAAIFMLFLLYIISISSTIKYYKLFNIKYLFYLLLGVILFVIVGAISYAARSGGELNIIFSTIDPILGLFRRLGIIDNITAIQTIDISKIEYFSIYNLLVQFILGFIPNSLFNLDYYGVSIGWAVAHYGLGQAESIVNAYETSSLGTALLFSHGSALITVINLLLLYMPILFVYFFTKDLILRYYALYMFVIITLTGDIRVDALLIKHILIYKFVLIPLITKKGGLYENSIYHRTRS